jgi:hypothetical protein
VHCAPSIGLLCRPGYHRGLQQQTHTGRYLAKISSSKNQQNQQDNISKTISIQKRQNMNKTAKNSKNWQKSPEQFHRSKNQVCGRAFVDRWFEPSPIETTRRS